MAAPFEAMSVVSSPLQVAGILLRPLPSGGVVAGAELTATSDAAITPVTAIRLLLSSMLLSAGSAEQGRQLGSYREQQRAFACQSLGTSDEFVPKPTHIDPDRA
jgi:hypothetical protein